MYPPVAGTGIEIIIVKTHVRAAKMLVIAIEKGLLGRK